MIDTRKIAFTCITIFLVPLLFFALLELGLRAFGVGKSFEYFRTIDIDGQTYFQENTDFADQFYPESLDISPREYTFSVERQPDLTRVYILGGSAALGFPHKNHGLDRLLTAQLQSAFPARKIEVINTAMTSVNSHVVYAVANSIPEDSADFAVILMGNNEVVGPYGPGTFKRNFLGSITAIRTIQALKRTRTWQALSSLILNVGSTDAVQDLKWEGMQMFTNNGVPHNDPRMQSVYGHYEDNLTSIVETLQDKGMHVILSSVPVNLRHSAPFLSVHRPDLSENQLGTWRELSRRGIQNANSGNWTEAVSSFQAAIEIDPGYADTHFRLATAFEELGEFEQAKSHYQRALDLDALRFRTDSGLSQTIQNVATNVDDGGFSFVDSAGAFEQASEPFQPGWNLLLEHVHYSFAGNHVLAAGIAEAIVDASALDAEFEPLPVAEVARRVAFPNYDTPAEIKTLQAMIEQPPFPGQSNYADLAASLNERLERLPGEIGSPTDVIRMRRELVNSGLADWKIHFELAVLNERRRNTSRMYYHLDRILELYPHNRESYLKIAEARRREGKWAEVIPALERSLHYTRGDEVKIAETYSGLGSAYLRVGDYDHGKALLLELASEYPEQVPLVLRAYGNLVQYSQEQGKVRDLERYIKDVRRYGQSLERSGKSDEYPRLNQTMAQILAIGGYSEEAREWAAKGRP